MDKIQGSGSGSGRVGVSKNMIGYFRVSSFLSGISGYFGYFRVFPDISGYVGYVRVFLGLPIYPEYRVVPETLGLPEISGNTRCFGLPATR